MLVRAYMFTPFYQFIYYFTVFLSFLSSSITTKKDNSIRLKGKTVSINWTELNDYKLGCSELEDFISKPVICFLFEYWANSNSKLYMDTLHIICIDNFTIETHEVVVVGLYI